MGKAAAKVTESQVAEKPAVAAKPAPRAIPVLDDKTVDRVIRLMGTMGEFPDNEVGDAIRRAYERLDEIERQGLAR